MTQILREVQEQAKLFYGDRIQNSGHLGTDGNGAKENFLGHWKSFQDSYG